MATLQSNTAKRLTPVPTPEQAGQVTSLVFDYTFNPVGLVAASDRVELGVLPPYAKVVDWHVVANNLNGNIAIGLMSGEFGDPSNARTVGTEFCVATAMTTGVVRATTTGAFAIAPTESYRSIGLTGSADIAAGSTKTIRLVVDVIL